MRLGTPFLLLRFDELPRYRSECVFPFDPGGTLLPRWIAAKPNLGLKLAGILARQSERYSRRGT